MSDRLGRATRWCMVALACAMLFSVPLAAQAANLVERIETHGRFNWFAKALQATRYGEVLSESGPYTVFAFTDQAFERLPDSFQQQLFTKAGHDRLTKVMGYHVIAGEATTSKMFGQVATVPTLDGYTLTIEGMLKFIRVNGSTILEADIPASNGVVHLIDYVIIPPDF
ncbi:MAG: fasciclin domain-containing protein [Pseudomonadota bacterium]